MAGPCLHSQSTAEKVSSYSMRGFDITLKCLSHVVDGPLLDMAWTPLEETQTVSQGRHLKRKRVEDSLSTVAAATEGRRLPLATGASVCEDIEYAKRVALERFAEDFFNGRSGSGSTFRTSRWMKSSSSNAVEMRGDAKQTDTISEKTPLGIASCSPVVHSKSSTTWLSSLSYALETTDELSIDDEAKLSKLLHELAKTDLRRTSHYIFWYKKFAAVIHLARIWQAHQGCQGDEIGFRELRAFADEYPFFGLKELMMGSNSNLLLSWNDGFAHKFRVVLVRGMAQCERLCKKYGCNVFPSVEDCEVKVVDEVRDLIVEVGRCSMEKIDQKSNPHGFPLTCIASLFRTWSALMDAPIICCSRKKHQPVIDARGGILRFKPWKKACIKDLGIDWNEHTWTNLITLCQEDEQFMIEFDQTVRRVAVSVSHELRRLTAKLPRLGKCQNCRQRAIVAGGQRA